MNAEPGIPPLLRTAGIPDEAPALLDPRHLAENRICGFGQMSEQLYPFFMIRSTLLAHVEATGHRTFAITSIEAGNGKTHVATNLAAVLSRVRPTILVELDLRRPTLGARLGLAGAGPGIDDYLAGEAAWSDTATRIDGVDLAVHRVRRAHPSAEQLLASPRLAHALRHIAAEAEEAICIIDTPPALIGDDLVHIARNIDGVLLVAQEGRSRKSGVREVTGALGGTPIIGSILNMSLSQPARRNEYGYPAGRGTDREMSGRTAPATGRKGT
ncbi:CpsD/CapB family tyrosine-protein kinase [Novosphingobium sp. YAF33]|jgi:Mrp family chromosome partitioning ATPase|uniref:CpsD/CapB family tyrosine-protein kinase n=1 Tax=Novosphingobium sp. YAF33 TaxID=3233082 RepID=UPI003F95CBA7